MVNEVSLQGPSQDPAAGDGVPHSTASLSGWIDSFPLRDGGFALGCDLLGIRRIFYLLGKDLLHAGSSARMVRLAAELPGRLDTLRVRRAVRGELQPGSSIFESIRKLRPGFSLRSDPGSVTCSRALKAPLFQPASGPVDPQGGARLLKSLLAEAVRASFEPRKTAFLLSGGLDSGALLMIAAEAGLGPLTAYTFHTGLPGDDAELARAEATAARARASWKTVRIIPEELPAVFPATVRAMEDLGWSPLPAAKFQAFHAIAADGFNRVISGLGADEVFAGDPQSLRAWAPPGSATPLSSGQARVFREVLPELTVPAEVRPAQAHGLSVYAPYLHQRIVDFGSALPMHLRTDGNLGKLVLRWAVSSLLPDEIRLLRKFPRPLSLSSAEEHVRAAWLDEFASLPANRDTLALAGLDRATIEGHVSALRDGPYSAESERTLFRLHSLRLLSASL